MARSVAPTRPARTRRALVILLTILTAALTATTPATGESTRGSAPLLNRNTPGGAWAGYSTERSGERAALPLPAGSVPGMDVSSHQGNVDFGAAYAAGARFAYVKATEGPDFRSDTFATQYAGAATAGMAHGAYHFALPDRSSGAQQANFFVDNGGMWVSGTGTLPGVVDLETNPYGDACYGLDPAAMSAWIVDFSNTYRARTGRFPAIYTTTRWWNQCTGSNPGFGDNSPLWLARYAPQMGELPAGWQFQTIWQYSDTGAYPGGQDAFNGTESQLSQLAG